MKGATYSGGKIASHSGLNAAADMLKTAIAEQVTAAVQRPLIDGWSLFDPL
ncbi:MAG: hypothetical protein ACRER0_03820 [Gammaproteobacteria bacterium]